MSGGAKITNPLGAFGQTPTLQHDTMECVAGTGGVARGDWVILTWSATTGRVTATKSAVDSVLTAKYGVAEEVGAAGDIVKVTVGGFTFVNGGGNTFAVGEAIFRSAATVGIVDRGVPDATIIVGQRDGVVLGLKSATATSPYPFANAVPVWIGKF